MMRKLLLAAAAVVVTAAPAFAQDRLECVLYGDDYPYSQYPDGFRQTWWIDGDKLKQAEKGSPTNSVPGLAWMRILARDDDHLVATWGHEMPKGASFSFTVELKGGGALARIYDDDTKQVRKNHGTCKLVQG
jgi:hypothetical protein